MAKKNQTRTEKVIAMLKSRAFHIGFIAGIVIAVVSDMYL